MHFVALPFSPNVHHALKFCVEMEMEMEMELSVSDCDYDENMNIAAEWQHH